jgi:hypothetical protein
LPPFDAAIRWRRVVQEKQAVMLQARLSNANRMVARAMPLVRITAHRAPLRAKTCSMRA